MVPCTPLQVGALDETCRLRCLGAWPPARRRAPREDEAYLEYHWKPDGLLQWPIVQGGTQNATKAEDLAMLAAAFRPVQATAGSDCASTVSFTQVVASG